MAVAQYTISIKQVSGNYVATVYDDGTISIISSPTSSEVQLERDKQVLLTSILAFLRTYLSVSEVKVTRL